MRVVCVHPARDPIACGGGTVRIGSAPDDTIVPIGAGIAPHHVSITAGSHGLVLEVRAGCQRIYVNARAVRERAIVRYGDTVTLGSNKFLVTSDAAPADPAGGTRLAADAGTAVLRIVSGAASGQALAVNPELRLGAGCRDFADLAWTCTVARTDDGLVLECASGAPRVNGWRCARARLAAGDQIVLGEHRLVVEAPGLQYAAHVATLPPPPPRPEPPPAEPEESGSQAEVWWLIVAAALLALVIALFLYFRW